MGGGCAQAIIARCRVAWGKFKGFLPILTNTCHWRGGVEYLMHVCAQPYCMGVRLGPQPCLTCSTCNMLREQWSGGCEE